MSLSTSVKTYGTGRFSTVASGNSSFAAKTIIYVLAGLLAAAVFSFIFYSCYSCGKNRARAKAFADKVRALENFYGK